MPAKHKGPRFDQHPNGTYYVFWTEGRRSRRESLGTKTYAEASARFNVWLRDRENGPSLIPARSTAELWDRYEIGHVRANVASPITLSIAWAKLEQHFGDLMPSEIDDAVVDAYVLKRLTGKIGRPSKPPTIRRELVALRAALNWAASPKRKLLDKADVPDFSLPAASEPRDRWLRTAEIQALLNAAAASRDGPRLSRLERFLWLALETAARKTAIVELTWSRVDFETGIIHYHVPGARRTSKRRVDVPISRALRPVLERAYRERETDYVLDHKSDMFGPVQRLAKRAGVPAVGPHTLRHTAATHMARRGVPLWKIAGVLGNSVAMVEQTYAKHAPDGLEDAVNSISGGMLEAAE